MKPSLVPGKAPAWDPAWDDDPEIMPDLDKLVVEDGKAVDNLFVEKQYPLLTEPLRSSWPGPGKGRTFMVTANVGWFYGSNEPAVAPDAMLILDVVAKPPREKEGRSYFQWVHGKQPDVIIEIVSDRRGDEDSLKMRTYARQGVPYYVIFDPDEWLKSGVLRAFGLKATKYEAVDPGWFEGVGLGVVLWEGRYAGIDETWLRWCGKDGKVIPTGAERAEKAEGRARSAQRRAKSEAERAAKLAEQLRKLGVEPEA